MLVLTPCGVRSPGQPPSRHRRSPIRQDRGVYEGQRGGEGDQGGGEQPRSTPISTALLLNWSTFGRATGQATPERPGPSWKSATWRHDGPRAGSQRHRQTRRAASRSGKAGSRGGGIARGHGANLAKRYGESDAACHAIEAHHNDGSRRTVEVGGCGCRFWARPCPTRDPDASSVRALESIADSKKAEKSYAIQAGRDPGMASPTRSMTMRPRCSVVRRARD